MASIRRRPTPLVTAVSTLESFALFVYGTRSMYASRTSLLRSAQKYQNLLSVLKALRISTGTVILIINENNQA